MYLLGLFSPLSVPLGAATVVGNLQHLHQRVHFLRHIVLTSRPQHLNILLVAALFGCSAQILTVVLCVASQLFVFYPGIVSRAIVGVMFAALTVDPMTRSSVRARAH